MKQQLVVDKDGDWFVNIGQYPFIDPTNLVRFEPGIAVKIKQSVWMKGQPVIQAIAAEDVVEAAPPPPPVKVTAKIAAV